MDRAKPEQKRALEEAIRKEWPELDLPLTPGTNDDAAQASLVVVATHGRAGVQAIWAGSVATRLLARTRAPLLLLRRIETDDRSAT